MIGASHSGALIDYIDVERTQVTDEDLQVQLSRLCRYNGAVEFSVLQHLALCAMMAKPHGPVVAGYAAAHDLHEAYIGDLIGPLKLQPALRAAWKPIEDRWERHVHAQMGLPWPAQEQTAEIVKAIDIRALNVETVACEAHPNLTMRMPQGPPVTGREHDQARLCLSMRPPALWKVVIEAIRTARYELGSNA